MFCTGHLPLSAQYFFTGEVKDPHGDKLQNGSIVVQSTHSTYKPGSYGEFEIVSKTPDDSLTFCFDGYQTCTTAISANGFLQITLKKLPSPAEPADKQSYGAHLKSLCKGTSVSFSGNINRTSYNLVRKFLDMGYPVPHDAVSIEEILNYFNFDQVDENSRQKGENFRRGGGNPAFYCTSDLLSCPWNSLHKLLCLNIFANRVDLKSSPPANLVLLIDASGSMDLPNKLPIVKSGIRLLIDNLRDIDRVSVVGFGARVGILAEGIPGSQKERIIKVIEALEPDGPTPGKEGISLAYQVAHKQFIPGGNNKIILVTDGDINEDPAAEEALEDFIAQQSLHGIHLSCMGIGMGNYKHSGLPMLSQKGNGSFGYADNEQEVEKLFASQLASIPLTVAERMCITADFNPAFVKEYHLIGFDNRPGLSKDTVYKLEDGKIGSGQSIFALFELTPTDTTAVIESVADIKINYGLPGHDSLNAISYSCPNKLVSFEKAEKNLKRAGCVALFGMKLRESDDVLQVSWPEIEKMAKRNFNGKDYIDKEYLDLIAKAKKIYNNRKPTLASRLAEL